ncbi:MAG: Nif3-like dinuclear metal center hexameric protein [Oscillospiraceae bacterium]|jgi:dinuclear metal center YbgI/SA1388 family protein|nr:Nif3-like dinuclear metal center hexameric protein [Oscillospiraceae bacterium]
MPTVRQILDTLFSYAPPEGAVEDDSIGLAAGDSRAEVTRVVVALDATTEVIAETAQFGAQLVVSHHPVAYHSSGQVTDGSTAGRRIMALLQNGIASINMHTNLDAAPDGVNQALAETLGLRDLTLPNVDSGVYSDATRFAGQRYAICRAGYLERETTMSEFLRHVKNALHSNGLRYHDAGRPVRHVAVIGGSGGGELDTIREYGCDTFVTSDIKYSTFLDAREWGVNLIDADHFCTENVVVPRLAGILHKHFPELDIKISTQHSQTAKFYT